MCVVYNSLCVGGGGGGAGWGEKGRSGGLRGKKRKKKEKKEEKMFDKQCIINEKLAGEHKEEDVREEAKLRRIFDDEERGA